MSCLPEHGRINCTLCHRAPVQFDRTQTGNSQWRITANPLAWGNPQAEVVVLGFSKGQTQAGAIARQPHDEIAYKNHRRNVGKILAHVGLIRHGTPEALTCTVHRLIADRAGLFHFGSLIRCAVERFDQAEGEWTGTGGGMLDRFVADDFGKIVAERCAARFLQKLPSETKLVVMFGMGTKGNYIREARHLFETVRPGHWQRINDVAYRDDQLTVVHVEHFASQGAIVPNWLGENEHERATLGMLARDAVMQAALLAGRSCWIDGRQATQTLDQATQETICRAQQRPAGPRL